MLSAEPQPNNPPKLPQLRDYQPPEAHNELRILVSVQNGERRVDLCQNGLMKHALIENRAAAEGEKFVILFIDLEGRYTHGAVVETRMSPAHDRYPFSRDYLTPVFSYEEINPEFVPALFFQDTTEVTWSLSMETGRPITLPGLAPKDLQGLQEPSNWFAMAKQGGRLEYVSYGHDNYPQGVATCQLPGGGEVRIPCRGTMIDVIQDLLDMAQLQINAGKHQGPIKPRLTV